MQWKGWHGRTKQLAANGQQGPLRRRKSIVGEYRIAERWSRRAEGPRCEHIERSDAAPMRRGMTTSSPLRRTARWESTSAEACSAVRRAPMGLAVARGASQAASQPAGSSKALRCLIVKCEFAERLRHVVRADHKHCALTRRGHLTVQAPRSHAISPGPSAAESNARAGGNSRTAPPRPRAECAARPPQSGRRGERRAGFRPVA